MSAHHSLSHSHSGAHSHAHSHSHAPRVTRDNERKVLIAFVIIFLFMLVEAVGGVISGSLALLADAGHMLTDAAALGLAYGAFRLGRRAADSRRTFGYLRFEVIAGLVNALTLFGIVIWILYEAYERLAQPGEVLAGPMFIVALLGLLVNIFVLWHLTRGDADHVNIEGAILHVMGDLLGSIGAIAAAIVIWFSGWTPIDPILSVLVSLLILRSAWGLFTRTIHILLEGVPEHIELDHIVPHIMQNVAGVEAVSDVHVWLITSGRSMATLRIRPAEGVDIIALTQRVEKELRDHFGIEHPTVGLDGADAHSCSITGHDHDHSHDQNHDHKHDHTRHHTHGHS